jgi:hypothetical protein
VAVLSLFLTIGAVVAVTLTAEHTSFWLQNSNHLAFNVDAIVFFICFIARNIYRYTNVFKWFL